MITDGTALGAHEHFHHEQNSCIINDVMRARALSFALFLAIVAGSTRAGAADAATARARFEKGVGLYQVGEYRRALDEFKAAYLEKADAAFLYNMAQCHRQLGELREALILYRRSLAAAPEGPTSIEARQRIAEIEAALIHPALSPTLASPSPSTRESAAEPPPEPSSTPIPPPVPKPSLPAAVSSPPAFVAPVARAKETEADRDVPSPVYKKWWFWTAIVGVAAAAGTAAILFNHTDQRFGCAGVSPCGVLR